MKLVLVSNPVASELILPTAFETALCRFPTINPGRETALPCPLYYLARATGNDITLCPLERQQSRWFVVRNLILIKF